MAPSFQQALPRCSGYSLVCLCSFGLWKFCTTDREKLTPHSTLDSRKVFFLKKNLKPRENAKCKKCKDNQKKNRKEKKKKLYMRLCGLNGCYRLRTRKAKETRLMKFLAIHSFIHSINIFTGFKILSSVLWWLLVHSNRTNSWTRNLGASGKLSRFPYSYTIYSMVEIDLAPKPMKALLGNSDYS